MGPSYSSRFTHFWKSHEHLSSAGDSQGLPQPMVSEHTGLGREQGQGSAPLRGEVSPHPGWTQGDLERGRKYISLGGPKCTQPGQTLLQSQRQCDQAAPVPPCPGEDTRAKTSLDHSRKSSRMSPGLCTFSLFVITNQTREVVPLFWLIYPLIQLHDTPFRRM